MRSGVKVCVCGLGEKVAEERRRERRTTRRKSDMLVSLSVSVFVFVCLRERQKNGRVNCLNPSGYEKGLVEGCLSMSIFHGKMS